MVMHKVLIRLIILPREFEELSSKSTNKFHFWMVAQIGYVRVQNDNRIPFLLQAILTKAGPCSANYFERQHTGDQQWM